jgi:mannitol/fructose-specific phosphotransferase system IIA component (Ntr-type)
MRLSERFNEKSVIIHSQSKTKTDILEELVSTLVAAFDLKNQDDILDAVMAREKQKTTGIGSGIAIPHGKSDAVDRMYCGAATVPEGLEFESLDGKPAQLFILIVSPANTVGPHLTALSMVSKLMGGSAQVRQKLIAAESAKDFLDTLATAEDKYL